MVTYPSDWKITSIDKLGKCYSGLSGKSADDFGTGSAYYITFLNVLKNIKVDMDALEKVSVSSGENQNAVKKGDLFFNTSSETPDEVGMCAVLLSDLNNVYLNSFCFGFRLYNTSVLSPLFASYFFNSIYGRRLMSLYAQGSTRYNLSKSSFIKMEIPVPSIKEQQAIAATLSYFDEHIDNLTELIEKKKAIRDGALEDLVSGRIRLDGFSGEWKEGTIGDILTIHHGKNQHSVESFDGKYPILGTGGIIGKATEYLCDWECVLIGRKGTIDNPMYMNTPFWTIDTLYYSKPKINQCVKFQYYLFCTINWLDYAESSGRPSLAKNVIEGVPISIPNIPEQQAIAQVLTAIDEEIEALEEEKEKMIQIKEGAMDDLLTGRVRLKI